MVESTVHPVLGAKVAGAVVVGAVVIGSVVGVVRSTNVSNMFSRQSRAQTDQVLGGLMFSGLYSGILTCRL